MQLSESGILELIVDLDLEHGGRTVDTQICGRHHPGYACILRAHAHISSMNSELDERS